MKKRPIRSSAAADMLTLILNVIWFVLFGWYVALSWVVAGLLMFISIIGIPWGRSAFTIASFVIWPFGRDAISRELAEGREDIGTGGLGVLGNVVWFLLAGWWLALFGIVAAVASAITIIGIPFAIVWLKLAGISLAPVGKTIVDKDLADELRRRRVVAELDAKQRVG